MFVTILIGAPAILVVAYYTASVRMRGAATGGPRGADARGDRPRTLPFRRSAAPPNANGNGNGNANGNGIHGRRSRGNANANGNGNGNAAGLEAVASATVSVVIPALNEEGSLPWVLENLPAWADEIVIVDGLSTDATQTLARRLRPDAVVVHQFQRGKGAALRAGFAAASGDIVVMIDADGSTDPREMHLFVDSLKDGADFVKGSRHLEGGGSTDFTRLRSAGNKAFVMMANVIYGSRFTDICYGYCAFWRRHLDSLGLTADGFEIETQLVLGALKAGLEIREVPSFELERRAGTSNLNAARDGTRILRTMLGRDNNGHRTATHFTLQKIHLPVWSTSRVPDDGERRRVDRRLRDPETAGYVGEDRRQRERRDTVGAVVAYRAVYNRSASDVAADAAEDDVLERRAVG